MITVGRSLVAAHGVRCCCFYAHDVQLRKLSSIRRLCVHSRLHSSKPYSQLPVLQISGFYKGLASPLFGYGVAGAVAFSGYDWGARQIKKWRTGTQCDAEAAHYHLTFQDSLMAGMFAGFANNVPRTAVDRVKTVSQARGVGTGTAVASILRTSGPMGLFGGFGITMAREIPQFGVYFSSYGALSSAIQPEDGSRPASWQVASVGATAGVLQWLPPVYCVDVVKSRLQSSTAGAYRGIWHCAQSLYAEHGWRVFVRGLGPTLVRGVPLHATTFLTYETLMGVLSDGAAH